MQKNKIWRKTKITNHPTDENTNPNYISFKNFTHLPEEKPVVIVRVGSQDFTIRRECDGAHAASVGWQNLHFIKNVTI